jgi:hypothetical protein
MRKTAEQMRRALLQKESGFDADLEEGASSAQSGPTNATGRQHQPRSGMPSDNPTDWSQKTKKTLHSVAWLNELLRAAW